MSAFGDLNHQSTIKGLISLDDENRTPVVNGAPSPREFRPSTEIIEPRVTPKPKPADKSAEEKSERKFRGI